MAVIIGVLLGVLIGAIPLGLVYVCLKRYDNRAANLATSSSRGVHTAIIEVEREYCSVFGKSTRAPVNPVSNKNALIIMRIKSNLSRLDGSAHPRAGAH